MAEKLDSFTFLSSRRLTLRSERVFPVQGSLSLSQSLRRGSGVAVSLVAVKQSLVRGQVQKLRGAGRQLGGSGRLAAGRGRLQQRRVRAHFLDVDVRGVEEDVVFAAERREDGGDPGNQLRKGGATLGFGMPALHHHRVTANEREPKGLK